MEKLELGAHDMEASKHCDWLLQYHPTVDENDRLCMWIKCDSTIIFLFEMVGVLEQIRCTDIKADGHIVENSAYGYKYEASGKLPKELAQIIRNGEPT